jgi:hypothetical protein
LEKLLKVQGDKIVLLENKLKIASAKYDNDIKKLESQLKLSKRSNDEILRYHSTKSGEEMTSLEDYVNQENSANWLAGVSDGDLSNVSPYTKQPTKAPYTKPPTEAPYTKPPTEAPYTKPPTEAPYTKPPTEAPYTKPPTEAPYTKPPTEALSDLSNVSVQDAHSSSKCSLAINFIILSIFYLMAKNQFQCFLIDLRDLRRLRKPYLSGQKRKRQTATEEDDEDVPAKLAKRQFDPSRCPCISCYILANRHYYKHHYTSF